MISEKLAQAGLVSGPVGMAVDLLTKVTGVLQAILLVVTILATSASGLYYFYKFKKEKWGK